MRHHLTVGLGALALLVVGLHPRAVEARRDLPLHELSLGAVLVPGGGIETLWYDHRSGGTVAGCPGLSATYALRLSRHLALGLEASWLFVFRVLEHDPDYRSHWLRVPVSLRVIIPDGAGRNELQLGAGFGPMFAWDSDAYALQGLTGQLSVGGRHWRHEKLAFFGELTVAGGLGRDASGSPASMGDGVIQFHLLTLLTFGVTVR
jgi:hypothetical protein